jgi:prepilin-type N-terminal cleavage/methylation domain-containing protein
MTRSHVDRLDGRERSYAARRGARALSRGFTLVELLVSMVAGLIVAMSVVSLSAQATNTFHEESRIAGAEMQLRTAIDRLRADLQRAAFMSTGNIWIDPGIYNPNPGTTIGVSNTNVAYKNTTAMSLYSLAGIRLWSGGSVAGAPLSAINNLSPDVIDIGGNMTSAEILPIGGSNSGHAAIEKTGCGGNGWRIFLNFNSSPALWRLVGMSASGSAHAYGVALQQAFQPYVPTGAAASASSFIVRIVDNTTHKAQFYATCATTSACPADGSVIGAACWNPNGDGTPDPYIDLDATSSFDPTTLSGGVNPSNATINPVSIVRWQIQASLINPPSGAPAGKYDLTRWFLDAYGNTAGNPEVIAEYAADLKFAFTIDDTTDQTGDYLLPPASGASEPQIVYSFEDSKNASIAEDAFSQAATPLSGAGPQPQRIRSVRVRLATRAAIVDRDQPLPVAPVSSAETDYLYRYCTQDNATACGTPGNPIFARTRTLISEVALPNQASMWYR